MFKKIVLVATTLSIPAGVVGFKYWKTQNSEINTEGKKDSIFIEAVKTPISGDQSQVSDLDKKFLKIGETEKTAKEVLKDLLKTYTGSKILGKKIVDIFLSKFFSRPHDSFDGSAKFKALKEKKQSWIDELEKEDLYKDNLSFSGLEVDDFKETSLLNKYLEEFIDLLSNNFKIYLDGTNIPGYTKAQFDADKANLEYSDGQPAVAETPPAKKKVSLTADNISDKFEKEIADIWSYIFEDWYAKKRPILIKKFSWKYASSFDEGNKYSFADGEKNLIKDPTTPSYEFPYFDKDTCTKFKALSADFATDFTIKEDKLSDYSDNQDVYRVEEIGGIPNNKNLTSQEAIALLYLTSDKIFSGASVADCPPKSGATAINDKLFNFQNFKDKNPLEFFCIKDESNKDLTTSTASQIKSTDFFLAKDPFSADPNKKIVMYRDSIGVHLLHQDVVSLPANATLEIKKQLLIGDLHKTSNNFSLEKTLKAHLKDNYVSIFLRYFVKKSGNISGKDCTNVTCNHSGSASQESCIHQIAEILSKLFDLEQILDHDFKLKNLLLRDYYRPTDYSKIIATEEEKIKKAQLLSRGLAAPFPEEVNWSAAGSVVPSGTEPSFEKKSFICSLEKIFHQKESATTTADDKKFQISEAWDNEFACYKTKLESFFTSYTEKTTREEKSNTHHFKIKKEAESVKLDESWKSIDNGLLFDSILDQSMRDGFIEKLITSQELRKHIKLYSFENKKFKTDLTDAVFMKDSATNKYTKYASTSIKSEKIQKQLSQAIVEENYSKLVLQQALPPSFNNWDSSKSTKDDFLEFLQKSHVEQEYLNYKNFADDLSDQKLSFIKQITTAHWLIDNNFNNYREYLRKSIAKDGFGAYLFVNKFHPNLCKLKDEGLDKDHKGDWVFKNDLEEFESLFKRTEPKTNSCMFLEDRFSTAGVILEPLKPPSTAEISGFKGMIHSDNHDKIQNLPHTIWSKATEFLSDDKNLSFTQGSLKNTESSFKFGQHLAYLIAIRSKDVEKPTAFNLFLNSVSSDLILRDIAKLSRDASIQEQAISSFVMSGIIWSTPIPTTTHAQPQASGTNEYKKFTIGDNRLKESMSANYWIKI